MVGRKGRKEDGRKGREEREGRKTVGREGRGPRLEKRNLSGLLGFP